MNKLTFSQIVKNEISNEDSFSNERRKALLSAYLRNDGVLIFKNRETNLRLKSDNAKIAKYIYKNLKSFFKDEAIHLSYEKKKSGKIAYLIDFTSNVDAILEELSVDYFEGKISKNIVYNDDTIAGYIAGVFLACGSVNSPKTTNYHLELSLTSENYARWLAKLFGKYKKIEIEPKIIERREKYIIYFKKSEQIGNFLIMIGAPASCMEFEDERVERDFYNSENRLQNFSDANVKKASIVGRRQAKEIKYIDDKLGIHNLHNFKKEVLCYLRLENKELTLSELAVLMSEELGQTITKSNINHLFRSLHELYIVLLESKNRK